MARDSFPKGPNYIHPEKDSAVGSRNSLNRDGRNEYDESRQMIDEEVDKILNHISAKLPPEVLEKLFVSGNVKELLHNYFNQGFQNMFNRYLVTVEDEMSKKFRDMIDNEELKNLSRFTPKKVSELIEELGGADRFNTQILEDSIAGIYGHLQEHLNAGSFELERETRNLFKGKNDIGSFVHSSQAYSIIKCYLRDNPFKPDAVTDINLVINIREAELANPIYHYQSTTGTIVKDIISDHIQSRLDAEIAELNQKLSEGGNAPMNEADELVEKLKRLENYVSLDEPTEESPQFDLVAKEFLDAIQDLGAELASQETDPLSIRENVQRIVNSENLRTKGFNAAVTSLTHILDSSRFGYQHIENFKNARRVVLREYSDTDPRLLPDEHYTLSLTYYDHLQLKELRATYCQQYDELEAQVERLLKVFRKVFEAEKKERTATNYEEVSRLALGGAALAEPAAAAGAKKGGMFGKKDEPAPLAATPLETEKEEKSLDWDALLFGRDSDLSSDELSQTFLEKRRRIQRMFSYIRNQIEDLFGVENPQERAIMDQRLDFLESEFARFNLQFNPFHVQPGLVLDLKISTIKRQEITLNGMSYVIKDFLGGIARGFVDRAFKEHSAFKMVREVDQEAFISTEQVVEVAQPS